MDTKAKEFGKYLKSLRKNEGLTLVQLKDATSISQPYLSQMENGLKGIPSPETLKKLYEPLNVDFLELMSKAGHIPPAQNVLNLINSVAFFGKAFKGRRNNVSVIHLQSLINDSIENITTNSDDERNTLNNFLELLKDYLDNGEVTIDQLMNNFIYEVFSEENIDEYKEEQLGTVYRLLEMLKGIDEYENNISLLKGTIENNNQILNYLNNEKVTYNDYVLSDDDKQRIIDMLPILFPQYQSNE